MAQLQRRFVAWVGFLTIFLAFAGCVADSKNSMDSLEEELGNAESALTRNPGELRLCLNYASICERVASICLRSSSFEDSQRCQSISERCDYNLDLYCSGVVEVDGGTPEPVDAGVEDGGPVPVYDGGPVPVYDAGYYGCMRSGCSGQICAESSYASTCEWRNEYACYQDAICERQPNGRCGWTPTPELKQCLDQGGPKDCRATGCDEGMVCQICWSGYACLPKGAVC